MIVRTLLAGALLAAAAPVSAQQVNPDVKCLLVSEVFSQAEKDPARKELSAASAAYYFGRVDARVSPSELRSQILAIDKMFKPAELPAIMTACAKQVLEKQKAYVQMRQGLAAAAKAKAPPAK